MCAVTLLFLACAMPTPNLDDGLVGSWGGAHASLTLTASGGAAEFDCAHGELTGRLSPDRNGRFDVPGQYVEEHGGPVHEGEPDVLAVRYAGTVKNARMTLTVTRADTGERLGTFTLVRGSEPELVKCR